MTLNELNNFIEQIGNIVKMMAGEKVSMTTDEDLIDGAKKLGIRTPIERDKLPEWARKAKFRKGIIKGE